MFGWSARITRCWWFEDDSALPAGKPDPTDDANNQIQGVSGLSYDANGNQNVGNYDAQNKRIWSWPGTLDSLNSTTSYTVNMYSPGGQKLGAYLFVPATTTQGGLNVPELQVTLTSSDTYFGGRRLAVMDQLGSSVWNSPSSSGSFFPWGEAKGGYNPQDTWNFATYWQDSASGLDYANNRYYSNAYGRFMTPDSYSGGTADPQSWNKYSYTRGDPVNRSDPAGLGDTGDPCNICIKVIGTPPPDVTVSLGTFGSGGLRSLNRPGSSCQTAAANIAQYQASMNAVADSALTLNMWAYFGNVVSLALQALGSPDCAAVYNTTGTSDYTPQMVLQSMLPGAAPFGYWFGTIGFAPNSQAFAAATQVGGWVPGYGWSFANISINTGSTGDFFNGNLVNSVDTLLHELGHVFSDLSVLGGSKIVNDANPDGNANDAAKAANEAALAPCRTAIQQLLK